MTPRSGLNLAVIYISYYENNPTASTERASSRVIYVHKSMNEAYPDAAIVEWGYGKASKQSVLELLPVGKIYDKIRQTARTRKDTALTVILVLRHQM